MAPNPSAVYPPRAITASSREARSKSAGGRDTEGPFAGRRSQHRDQSNTDDGDGEQAPGRTERPVAPGRLGEQQPGAEQHDRGADRQDQTRFRKINRQPGGQNGQSGDQNGQ